MRHTSLALLCVLFTFGCGKPQAPTPVSVQGKVVFADGKPVKGMILSFHPNDEATKSGRRPVAALSDTGAFSFECLPGQYKATLGAIPKGAGSAATEGPTGSSAPRNGASGGGMDAKSLLLARVADVAQTPITVDIPSSGVADLVLTVK